MTSKASSAERLGGFGELTSLAGTSNENAEPERLLEVPHLSGTTVL